MQVHSIANQQHFGMAFKVNKVGAYNLACDFVNNPQLEAKFMEKIVAPLEKADADVVYNGYSAMFRHNADGYYSTVVQSSPNEFVTIPLGGSSAFSRTGFTLQNAMKDKFTHDFADLAYPYHSIETAKNLALELSAERSGKNFDTFVPKDYKAPNLGTTFEEKVSNLMKFFGMKEG